MGFSELLLCYTGVYILPRQDHGLARCVARISGLSHLETHPWLFDQNPRWWL